MSAQMSETCFMQRFDSFELFKRFTFMTAVPQEEKCIVGEWGPWSECKRGLTEVDGGSSRPVTDAERLSTRGLYGVYRFIKVQSFIYKT